MGAIWHHSAMPNISPTGIRGPSLPNTSWIQRKTVLSPEGGQSVRSFQLTNGSLRTGAANRKVGV
jgi:hypothetical protein